MPELSVLTGGAGAIGRATAAALTATGQAVVLVDHRADELERVAGSLRDGGAIAHGVCCDLSDAGAIERLAEQVRSLGTVVALVNNAGMLGPQGPAERVGLDDWERVLAVNLRAPWLLARAWAADLAAHRGVVVNVASTAGRDGSPGLMPYAVSKAGLIGFTRTLAAEWADRQVRVHGIAPGLIESELSGGIDPERRSALLTKVPMRRAGRPHEVASLIRYLVSEEASYVTGQIWCVDGGRSNG